MGGSGGGGGPIRPQRTPEQVKRDIERAEKQALDAGFKTELAGMLDELLANYNRRDRALITSRIEELKNFVADDLEGSISSLFGGSVAKHTYIDGLSDVDTLFVMKSENLNAESPKELLKKFGDLVKNRLGSSAEVSVGTMAVTVLYTDGMELQILPAVAARDGRVKVPSASADQWSNIAPRRFQEALSKRNEQCGGKLVPTIKLAKAINSTLPEPLQLSGYHIESMAVDVFRNYSGPKTTSEMLREFYGKASQVVLNPIKDSTGQSINVDDYLGKSNSRERQLRAGVLERIEKRMRSATSASSMAAWEDIFGTVGK